MPSESLSIFPGAASVFSEARFDHALAAEFFFAFSRAEYALKASGFATSGRYGEAKPNWDELIARVQKRFVAIADEQPLRDSIEYLESEPPEQQTWDGVRLEWRERSPRAGETRIEVLVEHVKTIRNNLFHGGKELGKSSLSERDSRLLKAGLGVLGALMSIDTDVANAFGDIGPDRLVA